MQDFSTEVDIWNQYRAGDAKAFEQLYHLYYSRLTNYAYKFSQNNELIQNAVQDVFTKLWKNRRQIQATTSVKNYLYTAFRRTLLRNLRQEKPMLDIEEDTISFDFVLSPETSLISKERFIALQQKLQAALANMNARQREIIYLKYYEDLSYEEIAGILSITVKGTYKLHYRALDMLKEQLGNFAWLILYWLVVNKK